MPPSPRYTVRLPQALDAQVQDHLRTTGMPFAVLMREALAAYLADSPPTHALTPADSLHTLGERLAVLWERVEALERALTAHRPDADTRADSPLTGMPTPADRIPLTGMPTPADRTPPPGAHAGDAVYARMQALRAQGLSLTQIAAQLTAEGWRTQRGRAWHKSTVAYILKTHGR